MASLWGEIKRRKVVQVAAVYAVVTWLLVQIVATVEAPLNLPDWFDTAVIVLLAVGFPIAVILAWAFDLTPQGLVADRGNTQPTPQRSHKLEISLVTLLIVAVVWIGYREIFARPQAGPDRLPSSVAVLPLDNLSPDPDNAYFAAGIHDEILNSLTKLRNLNVIARTSVLQYANTEKTIPQIGAELNVETVMEGSIRYASGRVRVTTQLIDTMTGAHLWSEVYERDFDDIFAIQSDIAMNVANALNANFSDEEQETLASIPTDSPVAYSLYLQGSPTSDIGSTNTQRALEILDQALAIDPDFAQAHGAKAWFHAQQLINTSTGSALDWETQERLVVESANRALEKDPLDFNANAALADVELFAWRWDEAEEYFDRYFERTGHPDLYNIWLESWRGQHGPAIENAQLLVSLAPTAWDSQWALGWAYLYAGEHDDAVRAFETGVSLAPANPLVHSLLAIAEVARRNTEAAARELELTEQILGDIRPLIFLLDIAYGYSLIGESEEAERITQEILARAEAEDIGTGGWVVLNLTTGDEQSALQWLEAGVENAHGEVADE